MRIHVLFALFLLSFSLFAQGNGGTVTGTVSDSSGALIPGAQVVLTNSSSGVKTDTVTTGTGNYTLLGLPVGTYSLSVDKDGFGKYEQTNIQVQLAVTTRVDIALKVGATTETVLVTAESSQLKTESGEQSMTLTGKQIGELPINFGIGAGAIRNPLSFVQMTPGASFNGWNNISINGGTNNFKILFEGQEADPGYQNQVADEEQPSVEAIEQFTLQTSNFSAEFGRVGNGGLYNFTSKSGTNAFHGSAYSYLQNTFLNAGIPFTNDGTGNHIKVVKHLADYGGTIGGPVWIPKLYDGRNKTFFFFNFEKYRDRESLYVGTSTVPNAAYLTGDLSNNLAVTGFRNLGTDFAGRAIIQNAIYDPSTATIDSSGRRVLNVFPNNIIPQNRFDPAAVKILSYFPKPNIGNNLYVNNFAQTAAFFKLQQIPSIKIDQNFGSKIRVSGYYGNQHTDKSNGVDGLPEELTKGRLQYIYSSTTRLSMDYSISPTLLWHFGLGFIRHNNPDQVTAPEFNFDPTKVGITAPGLIGFPAINTIGDNVYGGMAVPFGGGNHVRVIDQKPTLTSSVSWVHGNHTYKAGVDAKVDTFMNGNFNNLYPRYNFSGSETAQPLYGQTLPSGTGIGNIWASFLLGLYDSSSYGNASVPLYHHAAVATYLQDTWKVTRKLTLDYGIRWDLQMPLNEIHQRENTFSPTTPNPNANGLLGAVIYEGSGSGRCNCSFVPVYPFAIGPRIGAAYQIDTKTVIRGGWGLVYGPLAPTSVAPSTGSMGFNVVNIPAPGNGVAAGVMSQPLPIDNNLLYNAAYDPGLNVVPGGAVQGAPALVDRNGARPSRVSQWNISLQREFPQDVVIEAAFVGNHGVWENAGNAQGFSFGGVGNLVNYNAVDPAVLQRLGLGDLTNANTRSLLSSTITSPAAVAAGFKKPYANFPDSGTVLQSLRPFPQFSGVGQLWAPLGSSWYDALQVKLNKRFSHGLVATAAYSFSKALDATTNAGSIYNRQSFKGLSPNDLSNVFSLSIDYTIPAVGPIKKSRIARAILADWRIGTVDTFQSGPLLGTPGSSNGIGNYVSTGYTRQVRVPGVPLFLKDLNCGCIDPTQETVLNPAAWQDQAAGVPGSNIVYYDDFRGQRRPIVSASLGKSFRVREHMSFSIRAEFFNLLNQELSLGNPSTGSPQAPPTRSNGLLTGGFGTLNYTGITSNSVSSSLPTPRTGQIVARFEF